MIDNHCKLLELHVFVIIFLSDDNSARSASFSSSEFFLVLNLHKVALFCLNNELATLKEKQESGFGFSQ